MSEKRNSQRSLKDLATPAQWRNWTIITVLATMLLTTATLLIVASSTEILQRGPEGAIGLAGKQGQRGEQGKQGKRGKRGGLGEMGFQGSLGASGQDYTLECIEYYEDLDFWDYAYPLCP